MSHSDSSLKHFNPAANTLVIATLVLSATYVGWQLRSTSSTSEATSDIVANQVSAGAEPSETETAGSENSNPADDARNSGAVQTSVSNSPALKKPLQRARLSKATLLLQQRANATHVDEIVEKPSANAGTTSATEPLAGQEQSNIETTDDKLEETPPANPESVEADESFEETSDAQSAKHGLALYNNDEGAEPVTLMLDQSVRKIAIGGELRLSGDGPWAVRFIQGDRFVSNEGSLNAGTYRLQKAGAGWRLQIVDDSKSN